MEDPEMENPTCINCASNLQTINFVVSSISSKFGPVSISNALASIFKSIHLQFKDNNPELVMCSTCAEALETLCQAYESFLDLSSPTAPICQFVPQIGVALGRRESSCMSEDSLLETRNDSSNNLPSSSSILLNNLRPISLMPSSTVYTSCIQVCDNRIILNFSNNARMQEENVSTTLNPTSNNSGTETEQRSDASQDQIRQTDSNADEENMTNIMNTDTDNEDESILANSANQTHESERGQNDPKEFVTGQTVSICRHYGKRVEQKLNYLQLKCPYSECKDKHVFQFNCTLDRHLKLEHEKIEPQVCPRCGLQYFEESVLASHSCIPFEDQLHQLREMKTSQFRCEFCGATYKRKCHFIWHLTLHEFNVSDGLQKCKYCTKVFKIPTRLHRHENKHEQALRKEKKTWPCSICQRRFTYYRNLLNHLDIHKPRTLMCALCGKTFKQRTAFRRHETNVHSIPPTINVKPKPKPKPTTVKHSNSQISLTQNIPAGSVSRSKRTRRKVKRKTVAARAEISNSGTSVTQSSGSGSAPRSKVTRPRRKVKSKPITAESSNSQISLTQSCPSGSTIRSKPTRSRRKVKSKPTTANNPNSQISLGQGSGSVPSSKPIRSRRKVKSKPKLANNSNSATIVAQSSVTRSKPTRRKVKSMPPTTEPEQTNSQINVAPSSGRRFTATRSRRKVKSKPTEAEHSKSPVSTPQNSPSGSTIRSTPTTSEVEHSNLQISFTQVSPLGSVAEMLPENYPSDSSSTSAFLPDLFQDPMLLSLETPELDLIGSITPSLDLAFDYEYDDFTLLDLDTFVFH